MPVLALVKLEQEAGPIAVKEKTATPIMTWRSKDRSGHLLTPSPPSEQAAASRHQTRQSGAREGTGNGIC